jgi:hypothetical protein
VKPTEEDAGYPEWTKRLSVMEAQPGDIIRGYGSDMRVLFRFDDDVLCVPEHARTSLHVTRYELARMVSYANGRVHVLRGGNNELDRREPE